MRTHFGEMTFPSTVAWTTLAVVASAVTLAMIWGVDATQTVAVSSQPWPFAG